MGSGEYAPPYTPDTFSLLGFCQHAVEVTPYVNVGVHPGTLSAMDDTTIPTGGSLCPGCHRTIRVRARDGMFYWHRDTARKVGDQEAPWCWEGGMRWDGLARLGPIEPPDTPVQLQGLAAEMGTTLPEVNPRLVRAHLWMGISHPVQLPGSFFPEGATPPGEGLTSYAWLAFVTKQLYPFVGSVTVAYRVAKLLHQSRWPSGTPELPAGTLVRRRLEREAEA